MRLLLKTFLVFMVINFSAGRMTLTASTTVPSPPPKGISAWFYDQTPARISLIQNYDAAVSLQADGSNRQFQYLFPYGGSVGITGNGYPQDSLSYDPTVSQYYKSAMPGLYVLPNIDSGDGATFANWSAADQQSLAADIASAINSDPNASGVQMDIEPFNAADVPFYQKLRQLLNANGKVLAIFTGNTGGAIYSNVDIVAFSGYDLGITPVTPANYQTTLTQYVRNALVSCQSGGSYLLVGVPAGASYEEYQTETGTCNTNSGYTQEQWFSAAVSVLCADHFQSHYLGASLWGFDGSGLEIGGAGCIRNPGEPPADNWTLLEIMNPPACTFVTPTFTSTANIPTSTMTLTATPTSTATIANTSTGTPSPTASATATKSTTSTATLTFSATPTITTTATKSPTFTATVSSTWTNRVVNTATPTATSSFTRTVTSTPTYTWTPGPTLTLTMTSTATLTLTSAKTATMTATPTGSSTPTLTATVTPTRTFTLTWTMTQGLPAQTNTPRVTMTWTNTFTVTPSSTATRTQTPLTPTATSTETVVSTPTLVGGCSGIPHWDGDFVAYSLGQKVDYNGEVYQCLQAHTSESNWMPSIVPALWKDLGACGSNAPALTAASPVVYPNPITSTTAFIQLPVWNASNVTVQVFTVAMRQVQSISVPQAAGDTINFKTVDKSGINLANGLYYIVIQANGQKWMTKVLILR